MTKGQTWGGGFACLVGKGEAMGSKRSASTLLEMGRFLDVSFVFSSSFSSSFFPFSLTILEHNLVHVPSIIITEEGREGSDELLMMGPPAG